MFNKIKPLILGFLIIGTPISLLAAIEPFSSGEAISPFKINQNYSFIKDEMAKFNITVPFASFEDSESIKSAKFNQNLNLISHLDPSASLSGVITGSTLNAAILNNYFSEFGNRLFSLWINVATCDQLVLTSRYSAPGSYLLDPDGISPLAPKATLCDNTSKTKNYIPLKQVSTAYVLDNNSTTDNLIQFAQYASTSPTSVEFSGTYNLKHGSTEISTELVQKSGATYADTEYCDAVPDSKMCMVRFRGNTTLNGIHSVATRKKGLVIFVDGNLTINGSLTMTARGAAAVGQSVSILPGQTIAAYGGIGGARFNAGAAYAVTYSNSGAVGSNGAGGGGGAGAAGRHAGYTTQSGGGSQGTSWSGGSGGGGACSRTANSIAGDAQANGGAGGYGAGNWDWTVHGGAGNPGGPKNGDWTAVGNNGTGGTLILIVNGNLIHNGSVTANGVTGYSGGSSGGGSVNVFYKGSKTGSGTIAAQGGQTSSNCGNAYGGNGGSGTVRVSTY